MPKLDSIVFTVWPYFFLSVFSGVAAIAFIAMGWPGAYPAKSELVKVSGIVATTRIKDEISKTGAGAILPGFSSVYFTLEGVQGEFRYPSSHPQFPIVRDWTSGTLDLWVDGSEIGVNPTMKIWQLQEHSNYNFLVPETSVTYEEVIAMVKKADRSKFELGQWFAVASAILALVGTGARRWNRGRKVYRRRRV